MTWNRVRKMNLGGSPTKVFLKKYNNNNKSLDYLIIYIYIYIVLSYEEWRKYIGDIFVE
jgi:hypothetical protein